MDFGGMARGPSPAGAEVAPKDASPTTTGDYSDVPDYISLLRDYLAAVHKRINDPLAPFRCAENMGIGDMDSQGSNPSLLLVVAQAHIAKVRTSFSTARLLLWRAGPH